MKRRPLLLSAMILIVLLVSGSAVWRWGGYSWGQAKKRVVTVGFYENAPKIYTGENGRPAGLFIELLEEMARIDGWRLHYVPCKWANCLEQLEQGQLDLMPDVAFSNERGKLYDFHNVSVASSWSQVYTHPELKAQTLDDLAGKRIAVLQGGIQEAFLVQLMAGNHLAYLQVPVQSLDEGYTAVVAGKADAVVTNSFFAAHNGGKYKLQETPIVFLPSNLYFATGEGRNADLLARIDVHLERWRRTPDSLYFDALHRAMAMPPEVLMPHWVQWSLAGFGAAILSLLAISLLLRWQVGQRTRALLETANELKEQRANLEHLVAERTAELQALFDSACVGIVHLKDRIIVRCNRRTDEMFGYDCGEQIGQPTRIWYANEADWENGGRVYEQIRRGENYLRERQMVRKDGSLFWVRFSGRLVDTSDPAKGMVSVIEDITAERAAIEEIQKARTMAEEATRMKSEFLANMSHEIRTPMNAILGMLYLALKSDLSPSQRNHLSKAQGAAHSLLGIINDILDFSKIEAGKLEIEHIEFGLDSVLEQLTDAISFPAERKGIEFLIRYDAAIPPLLLGDPLRLGQVLLNLCGNAVKFTEQGEVELAFRCLDMTETEINIQISVRDSGIGMSPEVQQKLFDKFTQADQSMTRRFGGTGLGLAISKNLVELMGGRIWVDDSQPGKGSTICFTVQLQIARQAQARQRELVEQAGPLLQGIRVLVVDDNEVSREIMAEMLRFFRLDVNTVPSGAAALTELEAVSEPYDLVLMDWHMPGMNGDEATQHIHLDAAIVCQPKVVMVTAYGREDVIRLSEQAGVDGFLLKPVSPSILLDTILSVLGRKRIFGADDKRRASSLELATSGLLAGMRLLLVEDNEINREFATELLRSEGVEVDEAMNGAEAVTKVQQQNYDAVLMDVQMPVMDGLEAARRIRALAAVPGGERFARLPIIAMTALAMAQDAEKSQAAGMNDHVTKPVAPDRLMAVLAKWVQLPSGRTGTLSTMRASVVSPGGEIPPDLLALTSLDSREGIRRIGGKIEAYRKQLRRFREHYANAIVELQQLATEQGTQRAEEYSHILKGVTGNIGAQALYEKLSAIDTQLKQGVLPEAGGLVEAETLLQQVLCEINGLAASAEQPLQTTVPLTSDALHVLLGRLAHALKYDLGAAEPLIAELRAGVVGSPLETEVAAVAVLVDVFDIDAALGRLKQLETSQPDTMP